jgi:hypothetical protein
VTIGPADALAGLPASLRRELLQTFGEIVQHYRAGRWEPSELNGGKFCEVVYSILNGHVVGKMPKKASKPRNMVDACKALEQAAGFPRSIRIQIPRMLVALYEIRNNRNVGHVGGEVDPNHMDAVCILALARWILADLVRVFHNVSADDAAAIVESLTDREVPAVWQVGDKRRVLVKGLTTHEAMLLLVYSTSGVVTDTQLVDWLEYGNPSRFRTDLLRKAHKDRLVEYDAKTGAVALSPIGVRYVEENLPLHVA